MREVTVEEVMSWRPCIEYTRGRVASLWDGRESLTALEILDLDIHPQDRLWAVLRQEVIDESDLHELACRFASRALRQERKAGREPDPRSWEAVRVKRRWVAGTATYEELKAAWAAAWAAAESAAEYAAWAAAWAAAWTAAMAARESAMAARESAAEARWQVNCAKRILQNYTPGKNVNKAQAVNTGEKEAPCEK